MTDIKIIKQIKFLLLNISLIFSSTPLLAQSKGSIRKSAIAKEAEFDLNKLALPSEVKGIGKGMGAVFYSPSIKGKVLIPVHFWGEFAKAGLHFVPVDSSLLEGVSYAGGPKTSGKIDNVRLMRKSKNGDLNNDYFDLEKGGSNESATKLLRPGDMVFIEKDRWYENRGYYTSLVGVAATILSSILLYRQVKK